MIPVLEEHRDGVKCPWDFLETDPRKRGKTGGKAWKPLPVWSRFKGDEKVWKFQLEQFRELKARDGCSKEKALGRDADAPVDGWVFLGN